MEQTIHQDGWNQRNVDFSKAHGNEDDAFAKLLDSMNLKSGLTIGDIMSGYGGVSKKVLDHCSNNGLFVRLILCDAYKAQLDKSHQFLSPYDIEGYAIERRVSDARSLGLENKLDIAIIKMGLHEVPKRDQLKILQNVYDALKLHGQVYIWESFGQTPELNESFRNVVRKKDELAGFNSMAENRYFAHELEIIEQLKDSGFRDITEVYNGDFNYITENLLQSDFLGDKLKLQAWNDYLRSSLTDDQKRLMNFHDSGSSISMTFAKKIIKGTK